MFKKSLLTLFAVVLLTQTASAQMFLFVGEGCPHCANVEKYIVENDIMKKLDIKILEVYYNAENKKLYNQKAQEVGYQSGGVPFLVDGTQYKLGDSPIISYFEEKIAPFKGDQPDNSNIKTSVLEAEAEKPAEVLNAEDSKAINNIIKDNSEEDFVQEIPA
ncbi:MAG: hypothetical protein WC806_02630, partial [Candidatus Gracilibacteria bacterium]